MKLLMLTMGLLGASLFARAQNTPVTIEVKNIQSGKGSVVVSLYDKEKDFFKTAYISKSKQANSGTLNFLFDIPNGTYAISIYQDIDNNGKLDLGWFNVPLEPIGLGNNFKPRFSAPTFNECAVIISNMNKQFSITLK